MPPSNPPAPEPTAPPTPEPGGEQPNALIPVPTDELCVTLGAVERDSADGMVISAAKMRAVAPDSTGDAAELRFTYRGATREAAPLASGLLRRQLGLKLRAADTCNLVYVMWRIEPQPELTVSIKSNPGKDTHIECGAAGYVDVRPSEAVALPKMELGGAHVLRAEIAGEDLVVRVDDKVVWRGNLGEKARDLTGPAGLRTDNVQLEAHLLSRFLPYMSSRSPTACAMGED